MGKDEVLLKDIYISVDIWSRLEKHWIEDWNFHDRIDEVLQRAIEEYLEKRGR